MLFSDGGPCYDSTEFESFTGAWEFEHIMSSPHFAQSNGFIERAIQTVKRVLKKAKKARLDPELALLCVRATPIDSNIGSPAELLYNRPIKANLPVKSTGDERVYEHFVECQNKQKFYYDRCAKDLPDLYVGQNVGIQDPKTHKWSTGRVTEKRSEPRSYNVQTSKGSILRRNRKFLKDLPVQDYVTKYVSPQSNESVLLDEHVPEINPNPVLKNNSENNYVISNFR